MEERVVDLEAVTVELDEETLEAIDAKADVEHRGNRDASVRDLVDEWLKTRAADEPAPADD